MWSQLAFPFVDVPIPAASVPFLKWAGGKWRLLAQLLPLLPGGMERRRHIEPFVGGGAVFFATRPQRAVLSDSNQHLCATYAAVRDDVEAVIAHLHAFDANHNPENYYTERERYNRAELNGDERAALFIYLNKTCFNGLHRVNRQGEFNVPAGRYERPKIVDAGGLRVASRELRRAELRCADFASVLEHALADDFVYLDPPYVPTSKTASFTAYAVERFTWQDQQRLRDVFVELDQRGCKLMLSNSATAEVRALYEGYVIDEVRTRRSISCGTRSAVSELVVRNYGWPQLPRRSAFGGEQLEVWA